MSSLRNAVQRRNHRERAQPEERAKWGLLEKRKDYKLRAADHKTKQRKLKALSQKASERNDDEFYFGMVNARTKGGVKVSQRGVENNGGASGALSVDVVKLMKTQDAGYLRTMLQRTKKERKRVAEEVVFGATGVRAEPEGVGKRIVFGDSENDNDNEEVPVDAAQVVTEEHNESDIDIASLHGLDDLDDDGSGEETADEEIDEDLTSDQRALKRRKQHTLDVMQKRLLALEEQEEQLNSALRQVEYQRAKMNGTVGGVNKNGVKFKVRQRKR